MKKQKLKKKKWSVYREPRSVYLGNGHFTEHHPRYTWEHFTSFPRYTEGQKALGATTIGLPRAEYQNPRYNICTEGSISLSVSFNLIVFRPAC